MKKKTFALLGATVAAVLALASCGEKNPTSSSTPTTDPITSTPTTDPVTGDTTGEATSTTPVDTTPVDASALHIAVNYQAKQGISARETLQNPVENRNYAVGDILPVWSEFAKKINVSKFVDVAEYSTNTDASHGDLIRTQKYKKGNNFVDVFTTTTANINKYADSGEILALDSYIESGKMPNFKAFLDNNETIADSIRNTSDGKIYYTPYFDGYNKIERMFLMDTAMIEALLDSDADTGDTSASGKNAAANTLQENKYTPFIDADHNYPNATTTVKVSKGAVASDMTIAQTDNIIKQQNELLAAGTTGKALLQQFKDYLNAAFGANVGADKTYSKLSEIFTSESAAYNTDEMIALMRVVKANPGVVTGDATAEVEIMVPRQGANNRVDNIADLIQIFGVMGMDAEAEMLYFGPDGAIHDGASTKATYQAIEILHGLYQEGLLLNDFYKKSDGINVNYLQVYFGHTQQTKDSKDGYGFMMYDYSASTTAMDSKDEDGLGTDDSTRLGSFKNQAVTGFTPVLPPLTYVATEATGWTVDDDITSKSGKTLVRYSDSNRALKNASWCIPATSDNKEKAIALLDHLYSVDGVRVNDFGPSTYWKSSTDLGTYAGEPTPEFSDTLKTWISGSDKDFWSFMRAYLGATHGIGYVRSASINYQATNKWGKIGTLNIENAISSGAVVLAKVDINDYAWSECVPTAGYGSPSTPNSYGAVTAFWSADKYAADPAGWAYVVVNGAEDTTVLGKVTETSENYTYAQVKSQSTSTRRSVYLYEKLVTLNPVYMPAEAQL